jgi:cytochrome c peroxidase
MYDGATDHLDLLPIIPLTNPVEMNADLSAVMVMMKILFIEIFLQQHLQMVKLILKICLRHCLQFMVMMISSNSKYDKFRRNEVGGTFSIEEAAGYALFNQNARLVMLQI